MKTPSIFNTNFCLFFTNTVLNLHCCSIFSPLILEASQLPANRVIPAVDLIQEYHLEEPWARCNPRIAK